MTMKQNNQTELYGKLDQWIDAHFDEQIQFLQSLISVPTDTPPGNNTPHALHTSKLLAAYDMTAEPCAVPDWSPSRISSSDVNMLMAAKCLL